MKKFFYSFLMGALALSIASCKDDKAKDPDGPDDPNGEMTQLSPTKSKEFLVETANDFLSKFNAGDQQQLIKLCAFFEDRYGYLDMPKEFVVDEEITETNPLRLVKAFAATAAHGNATKAGAASIIYTYTLDFEKFKGVYTPAGSRWVKAQESNDIIFRFDDATGTECELKATISSKNSDGSISWTDEYYDYYYDEEITEEYVYKFRIPQEINITLSQGSSVLANSKVTSSIDTRNHKINVVANVTAANITAAVKLDGTDTQVTQTSTLTVSGEELVATNATLNGNNLCNFDFYKDNMDEDAQDLLPQLLSSGNATVSVMKKVRIDATGKYTNALYEALNNEYDSWEYSSQSAAERAVTNAIATLNNQITAEVRYNNTNTVQARLIWDYDLDEWGNYFEYYIQPLILFSADDTRYTFDEYFSKGFSTVEDTWADLQESYEKVWEAAKKGR